MDKVSRLAMGCRECHHVFINSDSRHGNKLYFCPKCRSAREGILLSILESGGILEGYYTDEEEVAEKAT
jgi:hypothetical protein